MKGGLVDLARRNLHGLLIIQVAGVLLLSSLAWTSDRGEPRRDIHGKDTANDLDPGPSSVLPSHKDRTTSFEKRTARDGSASPSGDKMLDSVSMQTMLPQRTTVVNPLLHYFQFPKKDIEKPTPAPPTSSDTWVIILALSCFCFGVVIAATVAIVVYRRKKYRWKQDEDTGIQTLAGEAHGSTPKITILNNDPMNEFFRYKEGFVSQDMKNALNFLATPFQVRSVNETPNDDPSSEPDPTGLTMNSMMQSSHHDEEIIALPPMGLHTYINYLTEDTVWAKTDAAVWNVISSGVVVTIPEGAVPKGGRQIFMRVAAGSDDFHVLTSDADVQLTPIVVLSCGQLKRFEKPVEIKIPHRAYISPESTWKLRLRYSMAPLEGGDEGEWIDAHPEVRGCNIRHEVSYRYDSDFVYVRTYRLASFCVLGTGRPKRRCLRLTALVYAYPTSRDDGQTPVNIDCERNKMISVKLFVVDPFRDVITSVAKGQEKKGGVCICRPTPLRTTNEKDWHVILASSDDPYWPWVLDRDTKLKVISCDSIYRSLGTAFEAEYRLSQRKLTGAFQATFSVAQRRKHPRKMIHNILSTKPLYMQGDNMEIDLSTWSNA